MTRRFRVSARRLCLLILVVSHARTLPADEPASRGEAPASATRRGGASNDSGRSVDLRPIFRERHLEGRSQGARGTCSAFVMTGAIEYAVSKPTALGKADATERRVPELGVEPGNPDGRRRRLLL